MEEFIIDDIENTEPAQVEGPTQAELDEQLHQLRECYLNMQKIIKRQASARVMQIEVERAAKIHRLQYVGKDERKAIDEELRQTSAKLKEVADDKRKATEECHRAFVKEHNRILHQIAQWKKRREAAGIVGRREFDAAVRTIWRYLRQAGNDGITARVTEARIVEIQFKDYTPETANDDESNRPDVK